MRKKALIITYYWPPAGGPGVQRWLKFVKYLPEFDIDPVVYIPENPSYPLIDKSLESEVTNKVTILKHPIKEPYRLAKIFSSGSSEKISKGIIPEKKRQSLLDKAMLFIRGNFFIPDARKNWVKPSVEFLSDYLNSHNIDAIITTGPPHSLHLIGLELQKQFKIKWIADFRDPWTTIGYHKELRLTKKSQLKHKALEKEVLQTADQIIVTSNITKSEFSKITTKSIEVITNGYDYEPIQDSQLDKKFSISHIGSLLSKRNPEILWKVLADVVSENKKFANDLQLNFVGAISEDVLKSISNWGLNKYVNKAGYVSHNKSIKFQRQSQLLLLIEIDSEETKCIIPGKLFEYMVSSRPIIAIGPKGSDVEEIISETNTGNYFLYSEYTDLKKTILVHYEAFKQGNLKSNAIGLKKYSRRSLTESLVKLI